MVQTNSLRDIEKLKKALQAWSGFAEIQAEYVSVGLINQTWAIDRKSEKFIAQRVNPAFSTDIQKNIQSVSQCLREQGMVAPRLLETKKGDLFCELEDGSRWRLMERLEGVVFQRCQSSEQARSTAQLTARFHDALVNFDEKLFPIGFPFHDMPRHLADLEKNLIVFSGHPFYHQVAELAEKIRIEVDRLGFRRDLPHRIIHGDLKFNNFLFNQNSSEISQSAHALIDLDTLAEMPIYFDLGDAWRSWCNLASDGAAEAILDLERFRSSAEGYLSTIRFEITREELLSLTDALERLSLELCARFAADVLAEAHWSWDPKRFGSCAEHNWVRTQGQWSLYNQACETHSERSRFILG